MKIKVNNNIINLKEMNSFIKRFLGLMFKKNINEYLIFKTNAIHTFFCLEPIDVIMIDNNYNILYIYKNLKPFRIILPKKNVKYTIEMPKNTINKKEKISIIK